MRPNHNWTLLENNRLRRMWRLPNGSVVTHGKRVGKDCPLDEEARRIYVKDGPILTIKFLRICKGMSLAEAWGLIKKARGEA